MFAGLLIGGQGVSSENLLFRGEQSHNVEEPSENANGIGAPAKTKKIDSVPILVMIDQKFIGSQHVVVEAVAGRQTESHFGVLLKF
jgi:hypothetical protein